MHTHLHTHTLPATWTLNCVKSVSTTSSTTASSRVATWFAASRAVFESKIICVPSVRDRSANFRKSTTNDIESKIVTSVCIYHLCCKRDDYIFIFNLPTIIKLLCITFEFPNYRPDTQTHGYMHIRYLTHQQGSPDIRNAFIQSVITCILILTT